VEKRQELPVNVANKKEAAMAELKEKETIDTAGFKQVRVEKLLGDGGQGWVYLVDYEGKKMALKWYKDGVLKNPAKFYANLENNIKKGPPSPAFLWPKDLVKKGDKFGYIMDLRPDEYKDFSKILLGREVVKDQIQKLRWPGVSPMINAALNITYGFEKLHSVGYSYQDLNDGNFFIKLTSGNVLICDNDNVSAFGQDSGIAGKARYMAPEVVLGKANPNPGTDRFSLGVVLFLLFVNTHPLEGAALVDPSRPCLTDKLEKLFYGEHPVFIFDDADPSNRPVQGIHDGAFKRWPFLPPYAQEQFKKAFNQEALRDPNRRVTEREWLSLFIRLRDELYTCPSCGSEYFANPVTPNPCPGCGKQAAFPACLKTRNYNVPLHRATKLYACHTAKSDTDDFNRQTAEIMVKGNELGLKNLSDTPWTITQGVNQVSVTKDKGIKLVKGMKLDFGGGASAEII
jgi:DNA-binding helix-hairpin-helix protein with protein kinase domain